MAPDSALRTEWFVFTALDMDSPQRCRTCGEHMPLAMLGDNDGLCFDCVRRQRPDLAETWPEPLDSGMGKCSCCGSTNVFQFPTIVPNQVRHALLIAGLAAAVAAVVQALLGVIAWGLAVLGPALFLGALDMPSKTVLGNSRDCSRCGHRWPV